MVQLIVKRALTAIPTLFVVSVAMFILLFVGPNPLEMMKQNPGVTEEDIQRLTELYGWDKPIHEQYFRWAGGFLTGDWGESIQQQVPAKDVIMERLPLTLLLTGASMMFSLMIAIPVGAYIAIQKYSKADYAATAMTFGMMATPSFFLALLLQLLALFIGDWRGGEMLFYTAGAPMDLSLREVFGRMTLPIVALSLLQIAGWSRYQRSQLVTVLDSEYVKAAMAKGIPRRRVYIFHAMRNTMLPIITIVAIDMATLFGGAVITESVFALPGMGTLLLNSVLTRDVVVALDIVMISAFLMVLFNAIADVLYGVLDPRVRVS